MSKSLDKIEKDSASDESSDSKTAKSDGLVTHSNERRKPIKKKMLRSGNRKPRLSGGADEAATSEPQQRVSIKEDPQEPSSLQDESLAEKHSVPDTPPSSPVGHSNTLNKTGDAKADEILECVLKNLDESEKALACLGQNVEHEMKLFLVDLMGRIRKWSGTVESKMEWCRRDVIVLSKELANRMSTLEQSRRESAQLREQCDQLAQKSFSDSMRTNGQKMDLLSSTPIEGSGQMSPGGTHTLDPITGKPMHQPGMQASGSSDPCADPCAAAVISPCDQPTFVKDGSSDIAAHRAEQERLMACCAELEAEICSLKKENERIVKERAEYENAIQRALLKGVSSLNVETLKVLRCTPIPNCGQPCAPSSSIEPVTKSRDCTSPRSQRDHCGGNNRDPCGNNRDPCGNNRDPCAGNNRDCYSRAGASKSCNSSREALNGRGNGGRVCPGTGHSDRKSRKSKDNNMLLLLHQKDIENFGIQGGCDNAPKKSNDCGKSKKSHYQC